MVFVRGMKITKQICRQLKMVCNLLKLYSVDTYTKRERGLVPPVYIGIEGSFNKTLGLSVISGCLQKCIGI